jgi:hypothetical protein
VYFNSARMARVYSRTVIPLPRYRPHPNSSRCSTPAWLEFDIDTARERICDDSRYP